MMKYYILRVVIMLILFSSLCRSQETVRLPNFVFQETRQSSRHDIEVHVSVNLASVTDLSKATSVPVMFTVKNVSAGIVAILHVMDQYRDSVEICLADRINERNKLFPLPTSGGGSPKRIEPGNSISFNVDVPIELFRMSGKKFLAGVRYSTMIPEGEFMGEAFSEPFSFQSIK